MTDPRRAIPSVDRLLASESFEMLLADHPRHLIVTALKQELELIRNALAGGTSDVPHADAIAARVAQSIDRLALGSLQAVINATGVVLHTNLGRAPLATAAIEAMQRAASGYTNLEYDLDTGRRGSRYVHARTLLTTLTGAEDALVVNNNAAALVLALNTLSRRRDTIISRGELVEIGGAFRVPEIMKRSGARLREVGSTNRTHLADYHDALSPDTGTLLKVHRSNFAITGFTAEVHVRELADLARQHETPLVHDVGSGLLIDPAHVSLPNEPWVPAALRDGADVVTMSGDKLLGGPQCGIVLGRGDLIERMRRNPLCRALRVDKLTLAALEATLRLYLDPQQALRDVPTLRMLTMPLSELRHRAERLMALCAHAGVDARLENGASAVGGGASPDAVVATVLVTIGGDAEALLRRLRGGEPIVIARIVDDRVAIDLRTVPSSSDDIVAHAVIGAQK